MTAVVTLELVGRVLSWVVLSTIVGAFIVLTIVKSEDPWRMVFRWALTVVILWYMFFGAGAIVEQGGYAGAFSGIPLTALCGLALVIVWRQTIAAQIARPFASLYDGGNTPPEPRPYYSVAQSRQKQGHYLEAVAEVRKQLERFPTDVEGHLLLAQIQAENLKDLPAAEQTIQHFCGQPGHAPKNIAFALYSMADWHLKLGRDREAARRSLQQIVQSFPETEFALGAAQRIAHLGSLELLLGPEDRKKFEVTRGPARLGLTQNQEPWRRAETEPGQAAAALVKHLEQHPLDTEAREKLAVIYAGHFKRLDLATDQLEQLIAQAGQPGRLIVHWLNLLADLQIQGGADYDTVRNTLQRIVDRTPDLAAAEIARRRLALLKLELKGQQQKQGIKLGTYEQNLGLKHTRGPNTSPG